MRYEYDAVVVGSGPNGLGAAITLAEHGCSVLVLEAHEQLGGGARTAELTLPGFAHDVCSAIHPMAALYPLFRHLALDKLGLQWVEPMAALAHPLDDGRVMLLKRSVDETADSLERDGSAYRNRVGPMVTDTQRLFQDLFKPLGWPQHPRALARFGWATMQSAQALVKRWFDDAPAKALFGGCAAHSFLPLDAPFSSAIGLALLLAGHATGWPCAKNGSRAITNALAEHLLSLGAHVRTNHRVTQWSDLPNARAILFDTSPQALMRIAADRLPTSYKEQLSRFRAAPGVFKIDWALDGPIPWKANACLQAATVHLGGTFDEIAASEAATNRGLHSERPFVLVAQQSLFDSTRAPSGKHTGWAYCHVPRSSTKDMTSAVERQVERFAPGFRDRILARHTLTTAELFAYNENYEGGDITGGANDFRQMFARPTLNLVAYATPLRGVYLCSSSTPPGGGVHGMCGYHAARLALRQVFGKRIGLDAQR